MPFIRSIPARNIQFRKYLEKINSAIIWNRLFFCPVRRYIFSHVQ